MEREQFERLVRKALNDLPERFKERLENVDIVIEDWPSPEQLGEGRQRSPYSLLGLYEGVPHTHRGSGYSMVAPDKITLFQRPIEARARSEAAVALEVERTLRHEIAHHFGISDHRLNQLEDRRARLKRRPNKEEE